MASVGGRRFYWSASGQKKFINEARSRLMKQVMRHRKGKKLKSETRRKIKTSLRITRQTGVTKHNRRAKWKR